MSDSKEIRRTESADINLAGLHIWIHGRQFPDATDYWDANWLRATARCSATGSTVEVSGAFLHVPEIVGWMDACEELHKTLKGAANLDCMEPELNVKLEADQCGRIQMTVSITPEILRQKHSIKFEIDQSYLPQVARECRKIIERFPVKGNPGG